MECLPPASPAIPIINNNNSAFAKLNSGSPPLSSSPSSPPLSSSPDSLSFGVVSGLWVPFPLPEVNLSKKKLFGKQLNVIELDSKEYLIGRELAALLNRETFNMYRTMKVKRIEIRRANPEQVEYFAKVGAVRTGTHSVTLIPLSDGVKFVEEALERQMKNTSEKKKKSSPLTSPYGSPIGMGSSSNPESPFLGSLGALASAFEESNSEDLDDDASELNVGSPNIQQEITDPLRALYLAASEAFTIQ
eukprot:TRINITY_DN5711_c0_g1_i2.p1 TRINITY_DN5711_c0_g1~~TRINITY_DN5711_c0_g1_i2.p1  ORF type:complete len:247 (-),score=47.27 TRINITY_DN5711_c0_g1_i2:174-914(-)